MEISTSKRNTHKPIPISTVTHVFRPKVGKQNPVSSFPNMLTSRHWETPTSDLCRTASERSCWENMEEHVLHIGGCNKGSNYRFWGYHTIEPNKSWCVYLILYIYIIQVSNTCSALTPAKPNTISNRLCLYVTLHMNHRLSYPLSKEAYQGSLYSSS